MPMTAQDQILNFLRASGPILPAKVAKNIKETILIASAHLADLVSQGKVKISFLKVGGSPLYYLPGQKAQLYQYASGNMNPKDLQVLNKLKEKQVLKEAGLDTLSKVALRSLKDFAIPLHVTVDNKRELFWKWYLLSEKETNNAIRGILSGDVVPKIVEEPVVSEIQEPTTIKETKKVPPEPKVIIVKEPKVKQPEVEKVPNEKEVVEETPEVQESEPEVEESVEEKSPVKEKSEPEEEPEEPEKSEEELEPEEDEDELAELLLEENKKRAEQKQREISKQTTLKQKKPFFKKVAEKFAGKKRAKIADSFLPIVEQFFVKLEINVEEKEVVRKNSEIEFLVKIKSVVGETTYFCKAKQKKRCDEKDLSAAYMQAQIKKLPLLFLYSNELSQKATEMLDSDAFKNALIKKIELE